MSFLQDLLTNLAAELIGLAIGVVATYFIVENALEKRRLGKVKPIARAALENRLYHFARFLLIARRGLLEKSDKEVKRTILDFKENLFVFIFEQTEKLIDIYGHLIPSNIQGDFVDFREKAGYFADAILHIKMNYELIDQLEEWKELRQDLTSLMDLFDGLVIKLTEEGLLSKDFSEHWKKMKNQRTLRHQGRSQ